MFETSIHCDRDVATRSNDCVVVISDVGGFGPPESLNRTPNSWTIPHTHDTRNWRLSSWIFRIFITALRRLFALGRWMIDSFDLPSLSLTPHIWHFICLGRTFMGFIVSGEHFVALHLHWVSWYPRARPAPPHPVQCLSRTGTFRWFLLSLAFPHFLLTREDRMFSLAFWLFITI